MAIDRIKCAYSCIVSIINQLFYPYHFLTLSFIYQFIIVKFVFNIQAWSFGRPKIYKFQLSLLVTFQTSILFCVYILILYNLLILEDEIRIGQVWYHRSIFILKTGISSSGKRLKSDMIWYVNIAHCVFHGPFVYIECFQFEALERIFEFVCCK